MYKNRFTAICLMKYSESKHWLVVSGVCFGNFTISQCHLEIVWRQTATQEDTGPPEQDIYLKLMNSYSIWGRISQAAALMACFLAALPCSRPALWETRTGWHSGLGVSMAPTQPAVLGPGTTCTAWPQGAAQHRGFLYHQSHCHRQRQ